MKKEKVKKVDLGESHRLDRASLRGITERFAIDSTSDDEIQQVFDTFADCRKCDSFTEFTYAVDYKFKTSCVKCGHEDEFTSEIRKNNLGGITIQITWVDKSKLH